MRSTTCYSDARANQTLDQTAAIVQRHGESTRPPLISFAVRLLSLSSVTRVGYHPPSPPNMALTRF